MSWQWLENPAQPPRWRVIFRVALKALVLFALVNIAFAALNPIDAIGRVSIYNVLVPGLERLPPTSYTGNIPMFIASHKVSMAKSDDEYRILLLGDSGVVAPRLRLASIFSTQFNAANHMLPDGRRMVLYNLGYPGSILFKDLALLEEALARVPDVDAVVWLNTLLTALPEHQMSAAILQPLPDRVRRLIQTYGLEINPDDERLIEPTFWDETLIGQRRALADMLRLQLFGFSWAATQHDRGGRPRYTIKNVDMSTTNRWRYTNPAAGQPADFFAFEVIDAARDLLGERPLIIVNEPIYRVDNPQYPDAINNYYRRDVYEHYRQVIQQYANAQGWHYVDLWDAIPPEYFTNSPLHYDGEGARILAERLADIIPQIVAEETP